MTEDEFVNAVIEEARRRKFRIEINRNNLRQIDFGNKKLHESHLRSLYPEILKPTTNVADLIERLFRGRPCTHKPMREIVTYIGRKPG